MFLRDLNVFPAYWAFFVLVFQLTMSAFTARTMLVSAAMVCVVWLFLGLSPRPTEKSDAFTSGHGLIAIGNAIALPFAIYWLGSRNNLLLGLLSIPAALFSAMFWFSGVVAIWIGAIPKGKA